MDQNSRCAIQREDSTSACTSFEKGEREREREMMIMMMRMMMMMMLICAPGACELYRLSHPTPIDYKKTFMKGDTKVQSTSTCVLCCGEY